MRKDAVAVLAASGLALPVFAGLASGESTKPRPIPGGPAVKPAVNPHAALPTPLSAEDTAALQARFTQDVWPLLSRADVGCVSCHNRTNPSQLHFTGDGPEANFKGLLAGGFLDPDNPSSLLARISTPSKDLRMPPAPVKPWGDADIERLRVFQVELYDKIHRSGVKADELFPVELLDPYTGKAVSGGPDNTFLTYTQLRGKIKTLFGDDWKRNEHDLFQENIAQFGGADFIKRFDETNKASATFLSALDILARDVSSRAYLASSGPFAGRAESLPSPLKLKAPDVAYREEITRLYRRLLFRNPTAPELTQAFSFLKNIYSAQESVANEERSLDFLLTVADNAGRSTTREFRVRETNEPVSLGQQVLDQSITSDQPLVRKQLAGTFTFRSAGPGAAGQRFELGNEDTNGNVSLAGLELKGPLPDTAVKKIDATDPSVILQGAWQRREGGGFVSFEDGNNNKGSSRIEIPITVARDGKYEVTVLWRKGAGVQTGRNRRITGGDNASAVVAEVYSWDKPVVANTPLPPVPPKGEARFFVDQTLDTIPFWDLKTAFKFGTDPREGVEINNEATKKRVVADAVRFSPVASEQSEFTLDDPAAEGGWPAFVFPSFKPFNLVGNGAVSDNNGQKGELHLLYRPSKSPQWKPEAMYRVKLIYPGQVDNDTRVPVVIRAAESTPIVQTSLPSHIAAGAEVVLDASSSYNLQGSPLKFTWLQTGGPRAKLSDPHAAKVTFRAEPMSPQQAAWEGLCSALMKHPDFLFTRPRSLAVIQDKSDRRRLHLVKVAQDLVARPPTQAEVQQLESGAPLSKLVDQYLDSQEFRDFYFRRIQLVLESHGSEVDDEPVRLWCYVAFNDLPFKEILTADYTVDDQLKKVARPAYHGKTGVLTMKGFVKGKQGLPHFNYAAQVTEKFLGYVYEVPPAVVAMRDGITAAATTAPGSVCYSCHRVLTPLAYQRLAWDDDGTFRPMDGKKAVDDTDRNLVPSYPYRGKGMEAFATQAVNKERFIRTIFQTHFVGLFGREMRYQDDERGLYKRLWDDAQAHHYSIRSLLRTLVTSTEYLNGGMKTVSAPGKAAPKPAPRRKSVAQGAHTRPSGG